MSDPIDYTLAEHPDETRRRLRLTGEWTAANALVRSERTHQYLLIQKERGFKGKLNQAEKTRVTKAIWDLVHDAYPPSPGAIPLDSVLSYVAQECAKADLPDALLDAQDRWDQIGDSGDHAAEIVWVHNNIDKRGVDPLGCPSRGAWTILEAARKDKSWFYEKMYRPMAQQLSKQKAAVDDGEYKQSKQEKMACEDIRRMIEEAVLESAA